MPTATIAALVLAASFHLGNAGFTTANFSSSPVQMAPLSEALFIASVQLPDPKTYNIRITAYSSSRDETDDTPFITASGYHVRDGIVAANFLPFGTKLEIPSLFGKKIFTVEDRMNKRIPNGLDIWMATKSMALHFGVERTEIVVINEPPDEQLASANL